MQQRLQGVRPVKVFVDTGFFNTVGDSSLLGDLVRTAGGSNVAARTPSRRRSTSAPLARLAPDVYLATSDSGTTLKDLRRDPKTKRLPAVKAGRVYVIDQRLGLPGLKVGAGARPRSRGCCTRMRFADLDAVTIDAFGTLVELR